MVNYSDPQLTRVFSAMGDPTRRAIVARLAGGGLTVSQLAAPFEMSLPAISKHLRVLEGAGLLSRRIAGRTHHCNLEAAAMKSAAEWMEQYRRFWEPRLDALGEYLAETETNEELHDGEPKD